MLPVPAADKVHLGALELDQRCVQARKHSPKGQLDRGIRRANLAGQDLRIGITGGAEKAQADQLWLLSSNLFDDYFVRSLWIRLVEHETLVPSAFDYGRKGHDANGREAHHTYVAVPGACLGWKGVKLGIANMDEKDSHRYSRSGFSKTQSNSG